MCTAAGCGQNRTLRVSSTVLQSRRFKKWASFDEASRLKHSLGANVNKINSLFMSIDGLRTTNRVMSARNEEERQVKAREYSVPCLLFNFLVCLLFLLIYEPNRSYDVFQALHVRMAKVVVSWKTANQKKKQANQKIEQQGKKLGKLQAKVLTLEVNQQKPPRRYDLHAV
jgi:hypothetical protein